MSTPRLLPVPGVPIGYLPSGKPVYPVLGGSEDFDIEADDESEDVDESEDDADDEGDAKGKYSPPSRAEWLKVQSALAKANAQAKTRREALTEREKELQALRDEKTAKEADDERQALTDAANGKKPKKAAAPTPVVLPDGVMTKSQVRQLTAQAAREAEERTVEKYRGVAIGQAARAALSGAGVQSGNVGRLVRLLDLDEVQIDDDGEVTDGLDEQIEALKSELPQLFRTPEPEKKPRRAPAPRAQAAGRAEVEERPRSSADQMAASILGSR